MTWTSLIAQAQQYGGQVYQQAESAARSAAPVPYGPSYQPLGGGAGRSDMGGLETIRGMGWSEFGLVGLIVGALFIMLAYLGKTIIDTHKVERADWKETISKISDKHVESADGLQKVVHELVGAVKELGRMNK